MSSTLRYSIPNVRLPIYPRASFLEDWDDFLRQLCGTRQYQIDAIRKALWFLYSGKFNKIEDLLTDLYKNGKPNQDIISRYKTINEYVKAVQLPGKLAATMDMVTGSGKTYVMFGISIIALSQGWADRILILGPSTTVESGTRKKFLAMLSNQVLKALIPSNAPNRSQGLGAKLTNGTETFDAGSICVENIQAVYEKGRSAHSSISECLLLDKRPTLVLNDEVHHVYGANEVDGGKEWKKFLMNPKHSLHHMIGVTGTPYHDNEYFNDVIYGYSFAQALNENVIKSVKYVKEDEVDANDGQFIKILANHKANQDLYKEAKPLTLFVTADIDTAKKLETKFKAFLTSKGENANGTLLVVSEGKEKDFAVQKLAAIDDSESEHEWIFSVSMLTEGWDSPNVFQIVPDEERAFNSRLLISQVLGRGLRVPPFILAAGHPKLTVFNHSAWSSKIQGLVDDVMEVERKIISSPIIDIAQLNEVDDTVAPQNEAANDRAIYHFDLHKLNQAPKFETKPREIKARTPDFSKGFSSQTLEESKTTKYSDLRSGITEKQVVKINRTSYKVEEIASEIIESFKDLELERLALKIDDKEFGVDQIPDRDDLLKMLKKMMADRGISGNLLSEHNRKLIFSEFNKLRPQSKKTSAFKLKSTGLETFNTKSIPLESVSMSQFKSNTYAFYSDEWRSELVDPIKSLVNEMIESGTYSDNMIDVDVAKFKTPLDIVFANHNNEKMFIKRLVEKSNAVLLRSWIKSRNVGFYGFGYESGEVGGQFNPDFILLCDCQDKDGCQVFLVVEIKDTKDVCLKNKSKFAAAKLYFAELNSALASQSIKARYICHMLSDSSFTSFFQELQVGNVQLGLFKSEFETSLDNFEPT